MITNFQVSMKTIQASCAVKTIAAKTAQIPFHNDLNTNNKAFIQKFTLLSTHRNLSPQVIVLTSQSFNNQDIQLNTQAIHSKAVANTDPIVFHISTKDFMKATQ